MKIQYNYHSHTKRCGHAIGSDEEYVTNAILAGYKILGFSDHAPFRTPEPRIRMPFDQFDDYLQSITNLKKKYKDQIEIIIGLECEYYPSQIQDIIRYREMLDYLILGQHCNEHLGHSNYDLSTPKQLLEYAESIAKGCDSHLYDIIAHPDIFMFSYKQWDEHCVKAANIIIDAAIRNNMPIELNCGGVKYGQLYYNDSVRYPYPHYEFFKLVKEKNAQIVLGLDIHDPQYFLDNTYTKLTLSLVEDLNLNILEQYDLLNIAKKRKATVDKEAILNELLKGESR